MQNPVMPNMMKLGMPFLLARSLPLLALGLPAASLLAQPVAASGDGPLAMMPVGSYQCERAGPPPHLIPQAVAELNFRILGSTSYKSADGQRGTYLLSARELVMTSAGLQGHRFSVRSTGRVDHLDSAGQLDGISCMRRAASSLP